MNSNVDNIEYYNKYIDKIKKNIDYTNNIYNQYIHMIHNNKNRWLNLKTISNLIINKCNGYIFGGFVRDSILHNHYASIYYNEHRKLNIGMKIAELKYTNLDYFPEYINRLLLPNDIDIYLPDNNIEEVLHFLKLNYFEIISKKIKTGKHYFSNLDDEVAESLTHYIIQIKPSFTKICDILTNQVFNINEIKLLLNNINPTFIIKLDIFTSKIKYDDPFFGAIDFECNGLYLTKHGISISNKLLINDLNNNKSYNSISSDLLNLSSLSILEKNDKMQYVIQNIIENKAIWIKPTNTKRIYKMILKDWKIFNNKIDLITNSSSQEICLICKENINLIDCKMKCCNGFLHLNCLINLDNNFSKKKCIHCNKFFIDEI